MYTKRLRANHFAAAVLLMALAIGAPLHAASDSGTATLAVTVDETIACDLIWTATGTSSQDVGNVPAGTAIDAFPILQCDHNLGSAGFAIDAATEPVTGGVWNDMVTISGSPGTVVLDPNINDSQPLGNFISLPNMLELNLALTTQATSTQAPGSYVFTFVLTATSI